MSSLCHIFRSSLSDGRKERYDEIVRRIWPESDPETVVVSNYELRIVITSMKSYFKDSAAIDPWWELLCEMQADERSAGKLTAIRELASAIRSLNKDAPVDTLDAPADTSVNKITDYFEASENAPSADTPSVDAAAPDAGNIAPPAPEPVDTPEEAEHKKCHKQEAEWHVNNPGVILTWMRSKNWTGVNKFDYFALTGNMEMLMCAHVLDFPRSQDIDQQVAETGDLTVFTWLNERGYVRNWSKCAEICAKHGHLTMFKFIANAGHHIIWKEIEIVIKHGHLNMLAWIAKRGSFNIDQAKKRAIGYGQQHIVDWIEAVYE